MLWGLGLAISDNAALGPSFGFFGNLEAIVQSYDRTQEVRRWRVSLDQEWAPPTPLVDDLQWRVTYSPQQVNRNGDRRRTLQPSGDAEQRLDDQEFQETFIEFEAGVRGDFGERGYFSVNGF